MTVGFVHRTIQNYLIWQLVFDRVNSLSRRFKDARARYRKVWCAECPLAQSEFEAYS